MNTITVGEFCRKFDAVKKGREWAYKQHPLKSKAPMSAIYPLLANAPDETLLLWTAIQDGVFPEETLREFARWCALQVVHLWDAPEIVIEYLQTGDEELMVAAAYAAAFTASDIREAARAEVARIAHEAAHEADCVTPRAAAFAAAGRIARAAAFGAYYAALVGGLERQKQNEKLLSYGNPFMD
jgi:hypothetical protein